MCSADRRSRDLRAVFTERQWKMIFCVTSDLNGTRPIAAIVPFDSCGMQSCNKKNVIRNIKKEGLCFSLKDNTTKFCTLMCFHRENYCTSFLAPEEAGGNLINHLQ